tara:strand:+ start:2775 stop:2942 length:168 start_codon:yes stop_codon:yes gene_type:complete
MGDLGHFGENGKEYLRKDQDKIIDEILKLKSLPFSSKRKLQIQKLQQKLSNYDRR